MIALPIDSEFGKKTSRESYLKPEDINQRLQTWKNMGFDTRGFVLATDADHAAPLAESQSRAVFPDPEDIDRERINRDYKISVPDRLEWEGYVNYLKEEKLRSLGVTFSDGESLRKSPTPSLMSRQASSQSSAMFTSPTRGAFSGQALPFPLSYQNAGNPISHLSKPEVAHFPRYSMIMPLGQKPLTPPNQIPQLSRSPGLKTYAPNQYLISQPASRGGTPILSNYLPGMDGSVSPVLPSLKDSINQCSIRDPNEPLACVKQQHASSDAQQSQQEASTNNDSLYQEPSKLLASIRTDQPQIASPKPRSHRQNASDILQREVDVNASHLGSTRNGSEANHYETTEETNTIEDTSYTNNIGTVVSENSVDITKSRSPKSSKASFSKLNVNAPEFRSEQQAPTDPTNSGVLAFIGQQESQSAIDGVSLVDPGKIYLTDASTGPHRSMLSVSAPEFTPRAVQTPFIPSSAFSFSASASVKKPGVPTREFSFSSSLPSLNPDAPIFKPHDTAGATPVDAVEKVFGEIKIHNGSNPAKKSKAIPIARPDEDANTHEKNFLDIDGQQDESGHITQAGGRQKRIRRDLEDSDQVPLFASSSQAPWIENKDDDRAAYFSRTPSPKIDEATVEAATDLLEELLDEMSATEASDVMRDDSSPTADETLNDPPHLSDANNQKISRARKDMSNSRGRVQDRLHPTPDDVARATIEFLGKSPQFKEEVDEALEGRVSSSSISFPSASRNIPRLIMGFQQNDGVDRIDHPRKDILQGVRYVEPSYEEIDAIVKHLNQDDSDFGIEREATPVKHRDTSVRPARFSATNFTNTVKPHQLLPPSNIRSDAPSPSPNRLKENFQYLPPSDSASANTSDVEMVNRNACNSPSYRPSKTSPRIHRLNTPGSTTPSDWDDAILSIDGGKFRSRTGFFDSRVNDVVGEVVQQHLGPMEKTLSNIEQALANLKSRPACRRPHSAGTLEIEHSDADDEDDVTERPSSRVKSPLTDRKYDQLKFSLNELAVAQQNLAPANQISEILDVLKELKSSVHAAPHNSADSITVPPGDIKAIVEEAVGKQLRGKSDVVVSSSQAAAAEKSHLQIAGLESMLKIAEARAEDEMKARRSTEDALADNQRLLRSAMQEAAEQREAAEATERSLQEYHEERHNVLKRTAMLEGAQENLENMATDLSEKNIALEGTLAEYRLSSDQWRTEINDARHEIKDLQRMIQTLKIEKDGYLQTREAIRGNLDRLQDDMSRAMQDTALDQTRWRGKEEEHTARVEMLSARLEAEARIRERLELEIERLEAQGKDAMKARSIYEQTHKSNLELEVMVTGLREDCQKYQDTAAQSQHEASDAKENARIEVNHIKSLMGQNLEAANNHSQIARNDLEGTIAGLEKQIKDITAESIEVRSRYEITLREVADLKHMGLREVTEAKEAALREHFRFHEQVVGESNAQHERSLNNALEDKARSETHLLNRLSLANERIIHHQANITLLEDKLEIANSAAHAAIQAAQSKKFSASPMPTHGSHPVTTASGVPEKISPQALRESILVLQEQLQERETRIEQLESELSAVDIDAPTKLKDADIEISWLRELLGVRIDDLEDIITTLSQPSYDHQAIKAATIRLKANLQMEQQEKERALAGGQAFPSLSSISNLAASPRALPLAAAAAWGNWRRGKENGLSNLSAIGNGNAHQTPSKPSPQSLLAGLMTPPGTSMRTTPTPVIKPRMTSVVSNGVVRASSRPKQSVSSRNGAWPQRESVTPPLMRRASYDHDASESSAFGDEGIQGNKMTEEEPFGPRLGGIGQGI